jgi:hypothetical protein
MEPPLALPDWSAHWNAGKLVVGASDAAGDGELAEPVAAVAVPAGLLAGLAFETGCGGEDDAQAVASKTLMIPVTTALSTDIEGSPPWWRWCALLSRTLGESKSFRLLFNPSESISPAGTSRQPMAVSLAMTRAPSSPKTTPRQGALARRPEASGDCVIMLDGGSLPADGTPQDLAHASPLARRLF